MPIIPQTPSSPPALPELSLQALCRTACMMFTVPVAKIVIPALEGIWVESSMASHADLHLIAARPFGIDGKNQIALFDTQVHALSAASLTQLHDLASLAEQMLTLWLRAHQARAQEALFRLLAETSTDTIVYGNLDGIRQYISPSVTTLLGYEPQTLMGCKAIDITHPDDRPAMKALLQRVREGQLDVGVLELRQQHRNGNWVWMEAAIRLARDRETGVPTGYVASVRDIKRRKALEARLERLATCDELTGLPNRVRFNQQLILALKGWAREPHPVILFYMDIDGFKQVNDQYGHPAGDALLREVASRLRTLFTQENVVARLGGDEFTAIMQISREHAATLCQRVIDNMGLPFHYENAEISVGISIGLACSDDPKTPPGKLLSQADRALYHAKTAGKNTFRFFSIGDPTLPDSD